MNVAGRKPIVPLGEVLNFRNDIVHPRDMPRGRATFVGLEHVEPHTGMRIGAEEIELSELTGRRARFQEGDIVYGYLRPYLNKVWVAEFDGLCSVDQYVFSVRNGIGRNYVAHFLRSAEFLRTAPVNTAPGQLPRIRSGEISATSIPLPPLAEQQRIAAILDRADALRRKRRRAIELLDSLTQSVFFDLFGRTQGEVSKWGQPISLSELAEIGSGITKGRKLNGQATRRVPYLAVANVQDRRLDLTNVKTIEATESEIDRYRLQKDDLLLTEGGDPDKLGRGTLWAGELGEAIHQNHIFRVRIKSNSILPLFLNWLVGSPYGKSYFLGVAKQTTGIASINKTQLSEFPTVVPSIDLQRRFVRLAQATSVEAQRLQGALIEAEKLFLSLQHRAFSGRL